MRVKGKAGGAEDFQVDVAVELELAGKVWTWCGAREESREIKKTSHSGPRIASSDQWKATKEEVVNKGVTQ